MTSALRRTGRGLALVATVGVLAVVGAACGGSSPATARTDHAALPQLRAGTTISVSSNADGPKVPNGFLGLSMEYHNLPDYVGLNPAKPDPTFLQLLKNLEPTGTPVLRMGGDSTDWTWWPVPHMPRPGGARFALTPRFASTLKSVVQGVHGKLLLGVNFEADSRRIAAYEEGQLTRRIGRSWIDAFELGNEPELYHKYAWYTTRSGKRVLGRPSDYTVQAFIKDYASIAGALPGEPLAGPESSSTTWVNLPVFLSTQPRLSLVTVHTYPLKHCSAGAHPTEAQLFQPGSLQGLESEVAGWVKIASARQLPLRVDEMNSVTCGGYLPISASFGPALWALNILPLYAKAGAAGVNFHTVPFSWQALIQPVHNKPVYKAGGQLRVAPEYYGLLAFAQLAPPGSQLLTTSTPGKSGLFSWADRTPSGTENVVLTNPSSTAGNVKVSVPSQNLPGTVTLLRAGGGLGSTDGVSLGGQSLSWNTGQLIGTTVSTTVKPSGNGHLYQLRLPAASAAILSFPSPSFRALKH